MTAKLIDRPEWERCEHSSYAGKTVAEMKCTACGMPFVGGTFTTTANPLPAPSVNDPAAFWSSLTPGQALALLKAAPKVAGAWESTNESHRYWANGLLREFHTVVGPLDAAKAGATRGRPGDENPGGPFYWSATIGADVYAEDAWGYSDTLEEAKSAADAALRAAGWLLVDEAEERTP